MSGVAFRGGSEPAFQFCRAVLLALAVGSAQMLLFGQGYFGTVSGVITDPSQGVVPGTHVTLVDQKKGYQFNASSDKNGRYLFTAIPPGSYSVSAEAPGFEKSVRTNVTVNVSENATANLALKVATAVQAVDVQSEGRALATEDAVTGQVVNRRLINDLPLVDRNVLDFVMLGPGVNDMSDQNSVGDTGTNFVSNGSRGASADILMDGASITNFRAERRHNPGHLHSVGGSSGRIQGAADKFQRGIRVFRCIGREHDHALRRERLPWQRLRLPAQHDHRCE